MRHARGVGHVRVAQPSAPFVARLSVTQCELTSQKSFALLMPSKTPAQ